MVGPHGFRLPGPGICALGPVWTVQGPLGPQHCCVEGFPSGCGGCSGLEESLLAPRGVLRVYFLGIGLGCNEDPLCQVEYPPLGICLRMWMVGCWGCFSRLSHGVTAISIREGWRCRVAMRRRS